MRSRRVIVTVIVALAGFAIVGGTVLGRRLFDLESRQARASAFLAVIDRWPDLPERQAALQAIRDLPDLPASIALALEDRTNEPVILDALRIGARHELRRTEYLAGSLAEDLQSLALVGVPLVCSALAGLLIALVYRPLDRAGKSKNPEQAAQHLSGVSIGLATLLESLDRERAQRMVELVHAGQLAAMGNLSAGLAHDLRNPLMAMSALIEAARRRTQEGETSEADHLLERSLLEIDRANEHVRDLLGLAPRLTDAIERFDLGFELREIARRSTLRFRMDNGVIDAQSVESCLIEGRVRSWRRVLFNLVENAAESVIERGDLRLKDVTVSVETTNACVRVIIADQGVGFEPKETPSVSTPYRTSKENGTGLGLFVAAGLLDREGYRLQLRSDGVGRGATAMIEPLDCPAENERKTGGS